MNSILRALPGIAFLFQSTIAAAAIVTIKCDLEGKIMDNHPSFPNVPKGPHSFKVTFDDGERSYIWVNRTKVALPDDEKKPPEGVPYLTWFDGTDIQWCQNSARTINNTEEDIRRGAPVVKLSGIFRDYCYKIFRVSGSINLMPQLDQSYASHRGKCDLSDPVPLIPRKF